MAKRTLLALIFFILVLGVPLASHAWATHYFGSNLRYGMTGTEVSFLQEYLQVQGYFHYPSITEYFGPVTLGAVKAWQAANGIPSTGFFGPISRAFVNETSTDPVVVTSTTPATTTDPLGPSYPSLFPPFAPTNIIFEGVPGPAVSSSASNGPTGYWPLDEGSGTIAYDGSGNALNGTWSGTMASASGTYYTAGLVGSSAGYFDGSDDYIEMSSSTLFNSQTVTMSAWIYPTADSVQSTIMGKEEQYKVVIKNGQIGILSTCDGLEWDTNQYVSSNVPLDAWTYVAFVMNGPGGVDQVYENGTLVATIANCGEITNFNSNPFEIGGYAGAQAAFTGAIDDARFYTRALTASEVQALYDAVTPPVVISLSPTSTTLASGDSQTFDATVSNASNTAVTWSALYGTINASGTYTAPSVVTSSLTDIVTATAVASSSQVATATITVVPPGLAVWLPLDEGTGTVANDISGNGNNGTWSGTMASASGTYYTPGMVGNYAGVFSTDGTTKILLTSPSALVGNAAKTMLLWFNPSALRGTEQDIAEFGDNTTGGEFGLELGDDEHINAHLGVSDFESPVVAATGTWYFAALTYDGSVTSLYVNSTLEATSSATLNTGDANFFIGQHLAYTGLYFAGDVDDVRVYTRALSQSEIQEIYSTYAPPSVTLTPSTTTMFSGATTTFTATLHNDDGDALQWTVYGSGTINPMTGVYTAPTVYATTTAIVEAMSQTISSVSSTATVTIVPRPITISVSPTSTSILADATTSFIATVSNASTSAVTWSAVYGSINSSGVYTAPSSTTSSTITDTITATSVADNTKIATATVTVTPGLLGWWPTREGSGSIAYDVSGNGNNATWYGTPSGNNGYYQSYNSTYAGIFDGGDNYLGTSVSWPTSGSLSLWADPAGIASWKSPAGWKYGASSGGYILIDEGSGGNWRAVFNSSGLAEADVQSTSSISTNAWSHLVMTWNKVGVTTTIALYVNATLQGSTTTAQNATSSIGPFYYGTAGQAVNNDFNGFIDDVRVYDRALTPSEIQGIYSAEESANTVPPSDAFYAFSGGGALALKPELYRLDLAKSTPQINPAV